MIGLLLGIFAAVLTAALILGSLAVYGSKTSHTNRSPATEAVAGDNLPTSTTRIPNVSDVWGYVKPWIKWVVIITFVAVVVFAFMKWVIPNIPNVTANHTTDVTTVPSTDSSSRPWHDVSWIGLTDVIVAVTMIIGLIVLIQGFLSYFRSGGGSVPKWIAGIMGALACIYMIVLIPYVSAYGWTDGRIKMHGLPSQGIEWFSKWQSSSQIRIVNRPVMIEARSSGQIIAPVENWSDWLVFPTGKCAHTWGDDPNGNRFKSRFIDRDGDVWSGFDSTGHEVAARSYRSITGRPERVSYHLSNLDPDGSCRRL